VRALGAPRGAPGGGGAGARVGAGGPPGAAGIRSKASRGKLGFMEFLLGDGLAGRSPMRSIFTGWGWGCKCWRVWQELSESAGTVIGANLKAKEKNTAV